MKFMRSVSKAARRSPKAKVELHKRRIVLICERWEKEKRKKEGKQTGTSHWRSAQVGLASSCSKRARK